MVASNTFAFVLKITMLSFFTPEVVFSGLVASLVTSFGGIISVLVG